LGHLWVIEQAAELFDKVYVPLGFHPRKIPLLSEEERLKIVKKCCEHLHNVTITTLGKTNIAKFASQHSLSSDTVSLIRGVRNETDFVYEYNICRMVERWAKSINKKLHQIYLIPPEELVSVSSSNIKTLCNDGRWETVAKLVPSEVLSTLKYQYLEGSAAPYLQPML